MTESGFAITHEPSGIMRASAASFECFHLPEFAYLGRICPWLCNTLQTHPGVFNVVLSSSLVSKHITKQTTMRKLLVSTTITRHAEM